MATHVMWGNPDKTLIYVILEGRWDWRDFYRAAGEVTNLMVTVPHRVNIILDLRRSRRTPSDFPFHAAQPSFHRRNVGSVIVVQRDTSAFPHFLRPSRFRQPPEYGNVVYARSLNEAHALINHRPA